MSARNRLLIAAIVVGGVLLLIDTVSLPSHSRLLRELNNAGHIPLFGILSLAILYLVRRAWPGCDRHMLACYVLAWGLSAGTGAFSELMQYFSPRDADVGDLLRDIVGATTFLAIHASFDRSACSPEGRARPVLRWAGLAGLFLAFAPVLFWSVAFVQRERAFPVICDFDSFWSRAFVEPEDARLVLPPDLTGDRSSVSAQNGRLLQLLAGPYPGLAVNDPYPDWRGYDTLVITLHYGAPDGFRLGLRIDDAHHLGLYADRFTTGLDVSQGANRFAVPLERVLHGPRSRETDMERIAALYLFGDSRDAGRELIMQDIRLK